MDSIENRYSIDFMEKLVLGSSVDPVLMNI